MSQLVHSEVNSEEVNTITQYSYQITLQLRIRGRHAGMKCDLKGIKHCSHCFLFGPGLEIQIVFNEKAIKA